MRFHWHTKPDYMAECEGCSWKLNSKNALGTAARHHDYTGHKVRIFVEYAIIYEKKEDFDKRYSKG